MPAIACMRARADHPWAWPMAGGTRAARHPRKGPLLAQSQNTKIEYMVKATWLAGFSKYGDVMVGDRAFEFYNERNPEDFVQIPWDEFDYVSAEVIGKKKINRFAIFTKNNGRFVFSTRDNKACLRAVREHVPADRLQRSMSFFQVAKHGVMYLPHTLKDKAQARQGKKDAADQ